MHRFALFYLICFNCSNAQSLILIYQDREYNIDIWLGSH